MLKQDRIDDCNVGRDDKCGLIESILTRSSAVLDEQLTVCFVVRCIMIVNYVTNSNVLLIIEMDRVLIESVKAISRKK
jgi:hypothetical protein